MVTNYISEDRNEGVSPQQDYRNLDEDIAKVLKVVKKDKSEKDSNLCLKVALSALEMI